jgi:hypothetical protein
MIFLCGVFGIFVASCGVSAGGSTDMCTKKAGQLTQAAKSEFLVGASDASIRQFLTRHHINFSFDRFAKRYQGIIRDVESKPGTDCAVVAYIYVDSAGNYLRSEFMASYTGT